MKNLVFTVTLIQILKKITKIPRPDDNTPDNTTDNTPDNTTDNLSFPSGHAGAASGHAGAASGHAGAASGHAFTRRELLL